MKKKPITEIKLEELQHKFLENRNIRFVPLIYDELYPYTRSLLLKFIKNKIFLPPEVISDTTKDVCLLIIDKYRTRPDFKIEASFAGYLKYKILEVLYAPQKVWEEQCGSLNAVISSDKKNKEKNTELSELSETLKFDYLFPVLDSNPEDHFFKVDSTAAIKSVWTVFEDMFGAPQNETNDHIRKVLLVSMAILLFFRKDITAITRFRQIFFTTETPSNLYESALLEIYNRLYT